MQYAAKLMIGLFQFRLINLEPAWQAHGSE
jgi:hypothetical protein